MRLLGLACSAIMLVSGCDRSPMPIEPGADSPATSANSAPTLRTTAKPPKMPAAARTNDATGAANFVVYWVKAFNYAASTGETAEMRVFAGQCDVCLGYADDFEALAPRRRVDGEAWALSDIKVRKTNEGFDVDATVRAHKESRRYPLTFVVHSAEPFELSHIYERP